jgi:cytochrome c oxidase subunit 2
LRFRSIFGQIFGLETAIAAVVFGLIMAAMIAAMVVSWRKRRRGHSPSGRADHNPLELTYVLILAGITLYIATTSLLANNREWDDPPPALRVQVTAFQWCWRFHYVGQPVTVTAGCDGSTKPVLVLPTGRPVELDLTSQDVLHNFAVPYLRFRLDIFPDHVNRFTFTLHDHGRWLGYCAQFCGLLHYQMHFYLQGMSPAAYGRWLHARGGSASGGNRP